MTRNIKFRVWHIPTKILQDAVGLVGIGLDSLCRDNDFIVMQYTGLKDKNGKEIYEGDIVKAFVNKGDEKPCHNIQIEWINYDQYGDIGPGFCCFGDHEEFEIIGNIYQSPELINA